MVTFCFRNFSYLSIVCSSMCNIIHAHACARVRMRACVYTCDTYFNVFVCVNVCVGRIACIAMLIKRTLTSCTCVKHSICYAESRYCIYIPSMSYPLLHAEQ